MVKTSRMSFSRLLSLTLGILLPFVLPAQSLWEVASRTDLQPVSVDQPLPQAYAAMTLDTELLREWLAPASSRFARTTNGVSLDVPQPDGTFRTFTVFADPVMHPDLAAKYPMIRTWSGYDPSDPSRWIVLDHGPKGFHAMITRPGEDPVFLDPHNRITGEGPTLVYRKRDYVHPAKEPFVCHVEADPVTSVLQGRNQATDQDLRTYRLALSCTGEYANFHGGTKASALAAMVTSISRINGIYERDFGVRMELIPDNDKIIFLDAANDPFSNNNLGQILGQNQQTIDAEIGSANYDVGHVYGTGGGGLATLRSPCNNNNKARAATGLGNPIGDPFDVDYAAHEFGHQFGGNHSYNNSCNGNRSDNTAWEPGSGSTIMAYTGICAPNLQNNSDDYFHGGNLIEARNFTVNGNGDNCPAKFTSGNQAPTLDAGPDYFIPRSTPFELTAEGNDPDADDVLTYTWEQTDIEITDQPPVATATGGPLFRSLPPRETPTRVFPALTDLISNTTTDWEVLPNSSRLINFLVTARDNHPGHGRWDQDEMILNVAGNSGPFLVTAPNLPITWRVGDTVSVTWSVADTDLPPVAAEQVDIYLSTDGGFTYPIVLANGTANDGEHEIIVPFELSTTCRVKIKGTGNVFFDISNINFTIDEPSEPTLYVGSVEGGVSACQSGVDTATFSVELAALGGLTGALYPTLSGLPVMSDLPDSLELTGVDTLVFHVWGFETVPPGTANLMLDLNMGGVTRSISYPIDIYAPATSQPWALQPLDDQDTVVLKPRLIWESLPTAETYWVELATSPAFGASIILAIETRDTFLDAPQLQGGTDYYWRVRTLSPCGEGPWDRVWAFRTQFTLCETGEPDDLPITIPDNSIFIETSEAEISLNGEISDVNVYVALTHTDLKDVALRLQHPDGSTRLNLYKNSCSFGENIDATFDDNGETILCFGDPAISGVVQPGDGELSLFNGLAAAGTWALRITDNSNQDGGVWTDWWVEVCVDREVPTAPLLVQENELTVPYCGGADLTAEQWTVSLGSTPDSAILYQIREDVWHGILEQGGMTLLPGDVFRQSDLAAGLIRYTHDGSGFLQDSFRVDVFVPDSQSWLPGLVLPINIVAELAGSATQLEEILCAGDSTAVVQVALTGGKAPASFRQLPDGDWQTDSLFSGLPAGDYQFAARDSNGLESSLIEITIGEDAALQLDLVQALDTIWATGVGGVPPYQYSWNGQSDTIGQFIVPGEGSYMVTVTDANGCEFEQTVEVLFLAAALQQDSAITCFAAADGVLTIAASGGEMPYEYRLNAGPWQAEATFNGLTAGSYTGEVQDAVGQVIATAQFSLTEPDSLALAGINVGDGTVDLQAAGGTPPYQYQLDGGIWQMDTLIDLLGQEGLFTFLVEDANGCLAEVEVEVIIGSVQGPNGAGFNLTVWPNPAGRTLTLQSPELTSAPLEWALFDPLGRQVEGGLISQPGQAIDLPALPDGVYLLRVTQGTRTGVARVAIRQ